MNYVWKNIVSRCKAKYIAFAGHSSGGGDIADLAVTDEKTFLERTFAVVLSDSATCRDDSSSAVKKFYVKNARHWVSSDKPLDTSIRVDKNETPRFSAGHPEHEWTPSKSMNSAFKFLKERYNKIKSK